MSQDNHSKPSTLIHYFSVVFLFYIYFVRFSSLDHYTLAFDVTGLARHFWIEFYFILSSPFSSLPHFLHLLLRFLPIATPLVLDAPYPMRFRGLASRLKVRGSCPNTRSICDRLNGVFDWASPFCFDGWLSWLPSSCFSATLTFRWDYDLLVSSEGK